MVFIAMSIPRPGGAKPNHLSRFPTCALRQSEEAKPRRTGKPAAHLRDYCLLPQLSSFMTRVAARITMTCSNR